MIADIELEPGDDNVDAAALYSQIVIDKALLARHIRHALQNRSQVTLRELCELQPLRHGLAELVAYLQLAGDTFKTVVIEEASEVITLRSETLDGQDRVKQARLPRVIFVR